MANYTFKNNNTGEVKTITCTFAEYDKLASYHKHNGFHRVFQPVAIKDSGSGNGQL